MQFRHLLIFAPLLALTSGLPHIRRTSLDDLMAARQSCVDTCGSTCYSQSNINSALNQGYSDYQNGKTVGSDSYPHEYYDDEGFDFSVSGPYYEFPILHSYKVYTGGSPGADRVVFNSDGDFAGLITHTGASDYDGFVQCTSD